MPDVVRPKPECRHCGAVLDHALSRCPRCGKRSWLNVVVRGWGQRY